MTERRDKIAWQDFAHTVEVVAGSAAAQEDLSSERRPVAQDPPLRNLAHTSEVLLASAMARDDVARKAPVPSATGNRVAGWPLRAAGLATIGLLCSCFFLILVDRLNHPEERLDRSDRFERSLQPPQLLATPKRVELVNASQSSAIVRLRLAPPGAGVAKVIDLAEPIPPASIQQFWRYPATSLDSPTSSVCLVYFTAAYASGAETDIPNVDLCHDTQILAVERAPSSGTRLRRSPAGPSRSMASYTAALLESLDLYADPSRRFVKVAKMSADGSKVVTVADNSPAQLWESSGRLIASLAEGGPSVEAVVFSPDGREVITFARGSTAQRWDTGTGELSRFGLRPTTSLASAGYALGRGVVLQSYASGGVGEAVQSESIQALPGERRLAAGSLVEVVQAYGAWTLVAADGDLGYVPSNALVRGGTTKIPSILIAGATQANDDIKALERRIDELTSAGGYAEAGVLAARYSEAVELRYGSEHPQYAAALDIQAQLAQAANRLSEAELLYRRAIAIREKALGACDPTVVSSLDRLEQLYRAQRHLNLAQTLARRSRPCSR